MKATITVKDSKCERNMKVITVTVNGETVDYRKYDRCNVMAGAVVREYITAGYEIEVIEE